MAFELLGTYGMILRSLPELPLTGGASESWAIGQTSTGSEEGIPALSRFNLKLLKHIKTFKPPCFVAPFLNPLTASCV